MHTMYYENIICNSTLYMENEHCYKFILYKEKEGILDECVDATYIIYLKNNGRLENIKNQLEKVHPTRITYIVENVGYKKCDKKLIQQSSNVDLVDGYFQIFNHAKKNNYNNVLILEDDFIWNEKIKDPTISKDICNFVNNEESNFIYYLGCMPLVKINMGTNHLRTFMQGGTQSVIYSRKVREQILKSNKDAITDWDANLTMFVRPNSYCYKSPLCYQTYPLTDNQQAWPNYFGIKQLSIFLIQLVKLDKQPSPGFEICYVVSDILFYLIVFVFLYVCYKITKTRFIRNIFKNKILKR